MAAVDTRWPRVSVQPKMVAMGLCAEAKGGQILTDQKTMSRLESLVEFEPVEELKLKGLARPVTAFNLVKLKS